MSTAKKFAGQTAVYGLSTIISRSIFFVLTPILVGLLSVKVYGIFTNMYSYASLIGAMLTFGMETTFFRYLNKYETIKDKIYANSFFTVGGVAVVFMLGTGLFTTEIATWIRGDKAATVADYIFYVRCFIFILVTDAICAIPFAKVRANGRPMRYGMIKLLNVVFVVFLNLAFLFIVPYIIKNQLPGAHWMAGWYRFHWVGYVFLSNLMASVFTLVLLLPEISVVKLKFSWKIFSEMVLYSWPVLIANISFIINENLDKILLDKLLPGTISETQLGIYGACAKISIFLSLVVQAFRLGAEPFFFSHSKNKNAVQTYARIMDYFVIMVSVMFVALVANIDLLKFFIRAGNPIQRQIYWSGLKCVPLLLFGYVSLGIYMNLSIWYKLSDQTKYGFYISGVGAIATIVLNVVFIPKYGYMASAWASLIAYTIMMILSYIWGQRNYPIPYNLKKNLAYIISSVLLVYLSFYVFNSNIFIGDGLLILFVSVVLYFEWRNLKAIFIR